MQLFMKTVLLFTICFLFVNVMHAQTVNDTAVYKSVQVQAKFPGGAEGWSNYLQHNLRAEVGAEVLSILPNKFWIIFVSGREEADCDHSTVCLPCVAPPAVAGWRYFVADRLVPSRAEKKAPAPFLQYVSQAYSSVHRHYYSSKVHR